MNQENRQILVSVKECLLQICSDYDTYEYCDYEQVEYLLQLIDYMLLGKLPVVKLTIVAFMEELISTSIYGMKPQILSTLHLVENLKEELDDNEIPLHEE